MGRAMKWAWCAATTVAASLAISSGVFGQSACDRECLRTMLDRYLAAVVAHDPSAAPVVLGFSNWLLLAAIVPALAQPAAR